VERRFTPAEGATVSAQFGIVDPLTGEPASEYERTATAGERSGLPGEAVRVGFQRAMGERTLDVGAGAYYSRQAWVPGAHLSSWAATADWDVPLGRVLAVSGEWYYGEALAGFGGGASPGVLFDGPARALPVGASGGWIQVKAAPS